VSDGVELRGFDEFLRCIEDSPDKLERSVILRTRKLAEQVAGQARQGAPVGDGRVRNSLQSFTEVRGEEVVGGVRTDYPIAIFNELGTGPVGDAHPHPAEAELNPKRRPDGWTYWSDEVARERGEDEKGNLNGFVYTEGMPAKAFMYNALRASEDEIMASLGAAVEEAMDAEDVRE
jgi:hypothetical protein